MRKVKLIKMIDLGFLAYIILIIAFSGVVIFYNKFVLGNHPNLTFFYSILVVLGIFGIFLWKKEKVN
jgi:hypothetical protein